MEDNHPWDRRPGALSSPPAIDVPMLREQVAGLIPRLRRLAFALARTPSEADDLVHSAIVRALARADQLRSQARPLRWMLGSLARLWTEETPPRRRQQRGGSLEDCTSGASELRRELLTLQEALWRLPVEQHLCVALVCVEGFSYGDAAECVGVPVSTLTVRLARARQALHRVLDGTDVGVSAGGVAEDTLMAYVDGELEAPMRVSVETALEEDASLALRIAQHRAQLARLHQAFNRVLQEPVPEQLLRIARSAPTLQRRNTNVVPLKRRQPAAQAWSWAQAGTIGATLLAGVAVGKLLPHADPATLTYRREGGLLADSTLARALSSQPGGQQIPGNQPLLIGASFHARSGEYCRTFALESGSGTTGLACHGADGWRVRLLAENEPKLPSGGTLPAGVSAGLEAQLGPPLDARAETTARMRGWR
jgi:RNA polymerase sigma-70 factor (ECF subfamily)